MSPPRSAKFSRIPPARNPVRRRIDRFIEEALSDFGDWYRSNPHWLGKERDCVNLFAHAFLARGVRKGAAVETLAQIRIEGAVRQPIGYPKHPRRPAAPKDLVIWGDGFATPWDPEWEPVHQPWVVMEWKVSRAASPPEGFDRHDSRWLRAFTRQNPGTYGYLVRGWGYSERRLLTWAKVVAGVVEKHGSHSRL